MQAKTNVQSQLVKLFQVKIARYGHEEKQGVRERGETKLNRAPRNHLRSQVLKMETWSDCRECGEKRQRKKNMVCLQRKNVTHE